MDGRPWARFDDLIAGTALRCREPRRVLTAVRPDEVAGVLKQVHDATDAGSWAFGYVTAPALMDASTWRPDWTDDEHARAVAGVREHIE